MTNGSQSSESSSSSSSSTKQQQQQQDLEDVTPSFVHDLRAAAPYIKGHRGSTMVVALSPDPEQLSGTLGDVAMLVDMGINIVLVVGAYLTSADDLPPACAKPVCDESLRETAGTCGVLREEVMRRLSLGQSVGAMRRHVSASNSNPTFGAPLRVVEGNFLFARALGVVAGVDYGNAGVVSSIDTSGIKHQLKQGNVVLVTNIAYSVMGEALLCHPLDVGVTLAAKLQADKLFLLLNGDRKPKTTHALPQWIPLERVLKETATKNQESPDDVESTKGAIEQVGGALASRYDGPDLDTGAPLAWLSRTSPPELSAALEACSRGVTRCHILSAARCGTHGDLLTELFTRTGIGCMVSRNLYEGIRVAAAKDFVAVREMLLDGEKEGRLRARSDDELRASIASGTFYVLELDGSIVGCGALLFDDVVDADLNGSQCEGSAIRPVELAAMYVSKKFRGSFRGDAILDYLEQEARFRSASHVYILTTRTAGWFVARGFEKLGPGHVAGVNFLPSARVKRIEPSRNALLYAKALLEWDETDTCPGERIGF